jgi:eukaryotic-like serine/threonine-protein kinase
VRLITESSSHVDLTQLKRLQQGLRGDLDNIVLTALRKDLERRYSSVEQLSQDVRRYLNHEPVSARIDTLSYRAAKFIRRNRWAVGLAAGSVIALTTATGIALHQASEARHSQARAERHFANVRKLANASLFGLYDAIDGLAGAIPAKKKLAENAIAYLTELKAEQASDPALVGELGAGYMRLSDVQAGLTSANVGDAASAKVSLEQSVELLSAAHRAQPKVVEIERNLARALRLLAQLEASAGRLDRAAQLCDQAVAIADSLIAGGHGDSAVQIELGAALIRRSWVYHLQPSRREARLSDVIRAQALMTSLQKSSLSPEHKDMALRTLGNALSSQGHIARGLQGSGTKEGAQQGYELNRQSMEIFETLSRAEPSNRSRLHHLAGAYSNFSGAAEDAERPEMANEYREKAATLFGRLAAQDPEDNNAKRQYVYAVASIANGHLANSHHEIAARALAPLIEAKLVPLTKDARGMSERSTVMMIHNAIAEIEATYAARPKLAREVRVTHCTSAVVAFTEARAAHQSMLEFFKDVKQDPIANAKAKLLICKPYMMLPE